MNAWKVRCLQRCNMAPLILRIQATKSGVWHLRKWRWAYLVEECCEKFSRSISQNLEAGRWYITKLLSVWWASRERCCGEACKKISERQWHSEIQSHGFYDFPWSCSKSFLRKVPVHKQCHFRRWKSSDKWDDLGTHRDNESLSEGHVTVTFGLFDEFNMKSI